MEEQGGEDSDDVPGTPDTHLDLELQRTQVSFITLSVANDDAPTQNAYQWERGESEGVTGLCNGNFQGNIGLQA